MSNCERQCDCKQCRALRETESALAAVFGEPSLRLNEPEIKVVNGLDEPSYRTYQERKAVQAVNEAVLEYMHLDVEDYDIEWDDNDLPIQVSND